MASVDWDEGLPLEVLALVARGKGYFSVAQEMQRMREVCKNWQQGFEMGVTRMKISQGAISPPTDGTLAERFPALISLDLSNCEMREDQLVCLRGMTQLRSLTIVNTVQEIFVYGSGLCTVLTGTGFQYLQDTLLTRVDLSCCKGLTDVALHYLRRLPIESLDLNGCKKLTNAGLCFLKEQPMQITDLNLAWCDFSDEGLEALGDLPLTRLNLSSNSEITDEGLWYLENAPLTELDLDFLFQITDEGLGFLRGMRIFDLRMSACYCVNSAGLKALLGMPLRSLDLSVCKGITDSGMKHLGLLSDLTTLKLCCMPQLTEAGLSCLKGAPLTDLNLRDSDISGDVLGHLKGFSALRRLSLRWCDKLEDADLENLAKLPLNRLDISGCTHITAIGVGHLSELDLWDLKMESCQEPAIARAKELFPDCGIQSEFRVEYESDDPFVF